MKGIRNTEAKGGLWNVMGAAAGKLQARLIGTKMYNKLVRYTFDSL